MRGAHRIRSAARALSAVAIFALTSPLSRAAGIEMMTLDDAVRFARENSRQVQRAKEYERQSRGRYVEEFAQALPQVKLLANIAQTQDELQYKISSGLFPKNIGIRSAGVELTQVLFTWGQVRAGISAAHEALATSDDEMNRGTQQAVRDVSIAFYDVLLAKELVEISAQNVEQKQRHLDESRRKLTAGTATDYDVLAAQVALDNARPDRIRAQNAVLVARERLRFLLAIGEDREVDAVGRLDATPAPCPTYEQAIAAAKENRPDLASQRRWVEVYRQLVKVARAGNKPRLDFNGFYSWKSYDLGAETVHEGFPTPSGEVLGAAWSAGLYLSFPVFDGRRTRGRVTRAESDLSSALLDEAQLTDAIALEVRNAVDAVGENAEIVRAISGTVAQAEKLLAMAEKGFEFGVKTRLDVEDAQLNLLTARGNLARAARDYRVAVTFLDWAMGKL